MLRLQKGFSLNQDLNFPDKSITHRAFILASIAEGKSKIKNASLCCDTLSTLHCLEKLGAKFEIFDEKTCETIYSTDTSKNTLSTSLLSTLNAPTVTVCPISNLPNTVELDCKNSGTTARLLAGLVAGLNLNAKFFGDQSLSKRPFDRIITPLSKMGVDIKQSENCLFEIKKTDTKLRGIDYTLPVASAQVKSAILLCGLFCENRTSVTENSKSRNHTENLLRFSNCKIDIEEGKISVEKSTPKAFEITIPNDFSTAVYLIALGLLGDGAKLKNVGTNPTRTGAAKVLKSAGAKLSFVNTRNEFFEEISDIVVEKSRLKPLRLAESDVASCIDEVSILTLLACSVQGNSKFDGVSELKFKESDRMSACVQIAKNFGQTAKIDGASIEIFGDGKINLTSEICDTFFDHRVAMTYAISAVLFGALTLSDANCISISCPQFFHLIGAELHNYALVGSDIKTSKSPTLYANLADRIKKNISYTLCQLPPNCTDQNLLEVLGSFDGANITMPFKQRVASLLNANQASVNVVWKDKLKNQTKFSATSTDGFGLIKALEKNGINLKGLKILLVGAGGAAVSALEALLKAGAKVNVLNRTVEKAKNLEIQFGIDYKLENFDGIVSCIPPCEFENRIPLNDEKFVFSATYKTPSNLLLRAKKLGKKTIDGFPMLYFQAVKNLEIWGLCPADFLDD